MDISSKNIDIKMPVSWRELSQTQLYEIYSWIASGMTGDEVIATAFVKWAGITVKASSEDGDRFIIELDNKIVEIVPEVIARLSRCLAFILKTPDHPVRIEKIGDAVAVSPTVEELNFEQFLTCDNNYAGYLKTKKDKHLEIIAGILYRRGGRNRDIKADKAQLLSVLYWWIALKEYIVREYPDLYSQSEFSEQNLLGDFRSERRRLKDSVETQIRALTKGDVTKRKEVLEIPVHNALAELNAQAREYREISRQTKAI